MSYSRRRIVGPAVTLATVVFIYLVHPRLFPIPNPPLIYFCAVVFAAYYGGMASGLISAAISLAFAVFFFADSGELFQFHPDNLSRVIILFVTTPIIAILAGLLKLQATRAFEHECVLREQVDANNRELTALRAAIDQIDHGIVLLDEELRAQFINRAFRRMWSLSDDTADSKPAFLGLVYQGRDTRAHAVSDPELDAYVAERVARIRTGDMAPFDIRLANGEVDRSKCAVLPGGGRMLSYTNVTDLVHQADQFEQLAFLDGMTGLFNRQRFLTLSAAEWIRFQRYERPLSLLMIDIDHFKSINDRFGHAVGDQAIIHVAHFCRKDHRTSDVVARIGGEEFVLLLPETDLEQALVVAERLRKRVAETPLHSNARDVPMTVSIGVAEACVGMGNVDELLKRADDALYEAKRSGRNRVVGAQPNSAAQAEAAA
jgi:diguanylate cyclase (GGDEF)-like protein